MHRLRLGCLVALAALLAGGCGSSDSDLLAVEVKSVMMDPESQTPVLFLVDRGAERILPLWIGESEAHAISLGLQGVTPARPLTHNLAKRMLDLLDARVERVVISDLKGNTYYATLRLRAGQKTWEVDSRPSDAVALALQFGAPVFLSRKLVEKGVLVDLRASSTAPLLENRYGFAVRELTPGVARYFGFEGDKGVIVTEITGKGAAERAGLRKGDILVRLDRRRVEGMGDVQGALANKKKSDAMRVDVYRKGEVLSLEIQPQALD
jgi:bifunctional DNase/RNase